MSDVTDNEESCRSNLQGNDRNSSRFHNSINTNNHNNIRLPTEEALDCEPIAATAEEDDLEALNDDPPGATTAEEEDEPEAPNDDPPCATTAEEDDPEALNDDPLSVTTVEEDDLDRGTSNDVNGMIVVPAYVPEPPRNRQHELIPDENVKPYVEPRDRPPALVVCVVLLMVVVVIGLSVGLGIKRSKVSQPTESPVFLSQAPSSSLAPSDSPTFFPTSNVFPLVAEQVKTELGIDSYQRIQDDKQSPQSKAARWIGEEDTWFTFPIDNEEERRHFHQRYALATFFYSTGGEESWIDDAKFLSDLHECEWIGSPESVTINDPVQGEYNITHYRGTYCENSTVQVTRLYMDADNLTGSIPEEIWGIEDLQILSLFNNFISGPIPDGLYNLTELIGMDVDFSPLTGTISTLIGKLSNLQLWSTLDASFTGTLPSEIGQLTQLIEFNVWNSNLTGTLPVEYSSLSNIEYFAVPGNLLTGTLPVEYSSLSNIWSFDVGYNLLTGTLPSWVSDRPSMAYLHLRENLFIGTIPNGSYPAIQTVSFISNMLTGTIPTSLFHGNLLQLGMSFNYLTGSLPNDLSAATNLQFLDIGMNSFTGSLPASLGQLTMLEMVFAAYNQLTGPLVDLGNCTLLFWLDVEGNDLTGTIPESYSSLPLLLFRVAETWLVGNLTNMCNNAEFQTQTIYHANCPRM